MLKKEILNNGLTVITDSSNESCYADFNIWFKTGAGYEEKTKNGISHLIEHLICRDSFSYYFYTYMEYYALTAKESVRLFSRIMKKDTLPVLGAMLDMVLDADFETGTIEYHKNKVIQEIDSSLKQAFYYLLNTFEKKVWGEHPYSNYNGGSIESINDLNKEYLEGYYIENFLKPDNMVISIAGGVSHREIVMLVNDKFSHLKKCNKIFVSYDNQQKEAVVHTLEDPRFNHLFFGFKSSGRTEKGFYFLTILYHLVNFIIGDKMMLKGQILSYRNISLYTIYVPPRGKVDHLLTIRKILSYIKNMAFSYEKEFEKIKEYVLSKLLVNRELNKYRSAWYAEQALYNAEPRTIDKLIRYYKAMKFNDFRLFVEKLLDRKNLSLLVACKPDNCLYENLSNELNQIFECIS